LSAQSIANGCYTGTIEMCSIDSSGKKDCYKDPADRKRKWYHLTRMRVKDDSVFVDQSPIGIHKKDTMYSASDGGFYYYRGTISKMSQGWIISLQMVSCDYCVLRFRTLPNGDREAISGSKQWTATFDNEHLKINSAPFSRSGMMQLRSETIGLPKN